MGNLVVEDDIEKGAVYVQPAVVLNKAQLAELIHEETDAGVRGVYHLAELALSKFLSPALWTWNRLVGGPGGGFPLDKSGVEAPSAERR